MIVDVLFVDLDGTLIDVFGRYHQLHVDLVSEVGGTVPIGREAYVAAKRSGRSEARIVQTCFETSHGLRTYLAKRELQIETPHYLRLDRPYPWTVVTLRRLRRGCGIHLVTARRSRENLDVQLRELGLDGLLDSVTTASDGDKVSAIRTHPVYRRDRAAIVGDTELDVTTGQMLGIPTIAVACGLRDDRYLSSTGADRVIANLSELSLSGSRPLG